MGELILWTVGGALVALAVERWLWLVRSLPRQQRLEALRDRLGDWVDRVNRSPRLDAHRDREPRMPWTGPADPSCHPDGFSASSTHVECGGDHGA